MCFFSFVVEIPGTQRRQTRDQNLFRIKASPFTVFTVTFNPSTPPFFICVCFCGSNHRRITSRFTARFAFSSLQQSLWLECFAFIRTADVSLFVVVFSWIFRSSLLQLENSAIKNPLVSRKQASNRTPQRALPQRGINKIATDLQSFKRNKIMTRAQMHSQQQSSSRSGRVIVSEAEAAVNRSSCDVMIMIQPRFIYSISCHRLQPVQSLFSLLLRPPHPPP